MEYQAPERGDYESGLTAKLLYNNVNSLIPHLPSERKIEEMVVKGEILGKEQLWHTVRGELEEFVRSYLFTGLGGPQPGFVEIFSEDKETRKKSLDNYASRLEHHYRSKDEADNAISELLDSLELRGERRLRKKDKEILKKRGKKLNKEGKI